MANKTNIAIFASGGGSNANIILEKCTNHSNIHVALVICNRKEAGVYAIAQKHGKPCIHISKQQIDNQQILLNILQQYNIAYIVLAGFLLKIPNWLVEKYTHKIINIHPALLPKYGGHGMYGHFVHEAVVAANEPVSGITIHLVDSQYDHGTHLFQDFCKVASNDTPETLAAKVLQLEHQHYFQVLEKYITLHKPL
jgi:phosphoribosylglycinamide formyltransferase 1